MERASEERYIITDLADFKREAQTWMGRDFAFDVETTGLSYRYDRVLGLALYFPSLKKGYYITYEHTLPRWDGTTYVEQFMTYEDTRIELEALFSQRDIVMAAHNAKFDLHHVHNMGHAVKGRLTDTLLAAQLLDENRKNGLKSLADTVLHKPYAKYAELSEYAGYGKSEVLGVPLSKLGDYAISDVVSTWELHVKFTKQLGGESFNGKSLLHVYNTLWMPLLVVLFQMELRGTALDMSLVHSIRGEYSTRAIELERNVRRIGIQMVFDRYGDEIPDKYLIRATEEDLEQAYTNTQGQLVLERDGVELPIVTNDMVGKNKSWRPRIVTFNTGSNIQLHELVFEYSGISIPDVIRLKTNKAGDYAVDKDNLNTLIFYNADRTPQWMHDLLEWRKATKFIGTYLDRFIKDANNDDYDAIYTNFNLAVGETGSGGTATGRLSSNGPNLQNIPSRGEVGVQARKMFVARAGHKIVAADLGQAELRVLAHYSDDQALKTAFAEAQDLHILSGSAAARMDYDELLALYEAGDPKGKEYRQVGKTMNFALQYGMGAAKFRRYLIVNNQYEVTEKEAQALITAYNERYFGATAWKERVTKYVASHGYIVTVGGRKRRLPDVYHDERWIRQRAQRQAINAIIQGSVGDIMGAAMIPIQKALVGIGGSLLLQVHDEIVAEVPTEVAELAAQIMSHYMRNNELALKLSLPLVADANVGDNWGEVH